MFDGARCNARWEDTSVSRSISAGFDGVIEVSNLMCLAASLRVRPRLFDLDCSLRFGVRVSLRALLPRLPWRSSNGLSKSRFRLPLRPLPSGDFSIARALRYTAPSLGMGENAPRGDGWYGDLGSDTAPPRQKA